MSLHNGIFSLLRPLQDNFKLSKDEVGTRHRLKS